MDYLWKTVVGAPASEENSDPQQNVAETVEKLVERVETSTLLEDRRDACRALKSLSKTYRLEVGAQAMDALLFVLQNDASDSEIVTYALDSLLNIICNEEGTEVTPTQPANTSAADLSVQFTEIFIKRKENIQLIIDMLPEFDFKIRYPTIKLLYGLLRNKLRECQDCILTHPMGISRMMDLLLDPREVIRNDTLLLLVFLTKSNSNIQKIVAFENAFDRILEIISNEGYSDGGVVVEDCLSILLNLLKMNTSNQNYFKEGNYIQRLMPFFDIPFDVAWNPQKINNLLLMFKVIRGLVSPSNPLQVTTSCQKVMSQSGVLQKLCTILLSNGIPAEVLTETINCVAEVIRGNQQNQEYFSRVNAPIEPPRPVIVILLMSMINEKQPFELRCAVLYCFQSFLYKNELGQAQIVETLLPTTSEAIVDVSAGQLLCSGFFSPDLLSNWFVAVALSHTLVHNVTQKEQLLRVQLATDPNCPPTSLLAYCSNQLQKGGPHQRRLSQLMLLSMWLSNSPVAVSNFLSIPTNIPYLTSQIGLVEGDDIEVLLQGMCAFLLGICICYNDNSVPSFTKDDLCKLIQNRIGVDIYTDKLSSIAKNEKYSQALQKPHLAYVKTNDVTFDYEFCNLFKLQEATILKIVHPSSVPGGHGPESNLTSEDHKLLIQYKELIREQDIQLVSMRKHMVFLQTENDTLKGALHEQQSIVQQLRDQISLLRVQKSVHDPTQANYYNQLSSQAPLYSTADSANSSATMPYGANAVAAPVVLNQATPPVLAAETNEQVPSDDDAYAARQQQEAVSNAESVLRQQIDHLSYELSVRDQNLHYLSNQLNSMRLYGENAALAGNGNGEVQSSSASAIAESTQYDYLMNENRRLESIIDQYKYWESSIYANANDQTATAAATAAVVPQQNGALANGSGGMEESANQLPGQFPCHQQHAQQQPESSSQSTPEKAIESSRLRGELETLRKEQEDLITLLADQDLKMQKYVRKLKDLGHMVNDDESELQLDNCQQQPQSFPDTSSQAQLPGVITGGGDFAAQSIAFGGRLPEAHSAAVAPYSAIAEAYYLLQQPQQQQMTSQLDSQAYLHSGAPPQTTLNP